MTAAGRRRRCRHRRPWAGRGSFLPYRRPEIGVQPPPAIDTPLCARVGPPSLSWRLGAIKSARSRGEIHGVARTGARPVIRAQCTGSATCALPSSEDPYSPPRKGETWSTRPVGPLPASRGGRTGCRRGGVHDSRAAASACAWRARTRLARALQWPAGTRTRVAVARGLLRRALCARPGAASVRVHVRPTRAVARAARRGEVAGKCGRAHHHRA